MHRSSPILLALLLTVPLLTGCSKVQARVEMKKGNTLYQQEDYRAALKQFQRGIELDPSATFVWRSLGLTALALYHPGDESPQNVGYGKTAVEAFQKYLADYPDDTKVRDYLLATLVNSKRYDDALAFLDEEQKKRPTDKTLLGAKVRLLVQAGRLDEATKLAGQQTGPEKAESLYSIAVSSWDKSYHDPSLDMASRTTLVDNGLKSVQEALQLKPDYFEAMAYYNLLLREKAKVETDANKRAEDIAQADEWVKKAVALRQKQKAAQPTPTPGAKAPAT